MPMTIRESSLRERSKTKRRRAIQRAALTLFAEQGYAGTTIAEIADAAEVAPRTVTLYFPSKLDIAMSFAQETAVGMTTTFRRNPQLTFTDVLDRWLVGEAGSFDSELATMTRAMLNANPPLKALFGTLIAEAAHVGGAALIAEAGLADDDPMLPIVGAVVSAALSAYLEIAATDRTTHLHQSFLHYVRSIIAAVRRD